MKKIFIFLILSAFAHRLSAGGCAFSAQADSLNNLSYSFTYMGFSGATTFAWDFGDGAGTSTLQNPTYVYSAPGNYNVSLTALNQFGSGCSYDLVIGVGGSTDCGFTYSGIPQIGETMSFTDMSVGPIVSYSWDFDDSTGSTQQNPSHVFFSAGTHLVCLLTTDSAGFNCNTCRYIDIIQPCNAAFQFASTGLTSYFIENSLYLNAFTSNYYWDFGDGSTSTLRYPSHTYSSPGNYTACLTISDGITCNDSACQTIAVDTVTPPGCTADFIFTQTQSYSIDIVNTAAGAGLLSYSWDFGDGNTSNLEFPNHTFASTGSYIICLSITDSTGCSSNFCDSLNVDSAGNISSRTLSGFSITVVSPSEITLAGTLQENTNISVYPDPAQQYFIVEMKNNVSACTYKLHSFTGSVCRTGNLRQGKNVVDIQQLAKGIYFIEILNSKGDRRFSRIIKE
jgi:PKD repeat protein